MLLLDSAGLLLNLKGSATMVWGSSFGSKGSWFMSVQRQLHFPTFYALNRGYVHHTSLYPCTLRDHSKLFFFQYILQVLLKINQCSAQTSHPELSWCAPGSFRGIYLYRRKHIVRCTHTESRFPLLNQWILWTTSFCRTTKPHRFVCNRQQLQLSILRLSAGLNPRSHGVGEI